MAQRIQKKLEEQVLQNRRFPVDVDVEGQLAILEQIRLKK